MTVYMNFSRFHSFEGQVKVTVNSNTFTVTDSGDFSESSLGNQIVLTAAGLEVFAHDEVEIVFHGFRPNPATPVFFNCEITGHFDNDPPNVFTHQLTTPTFITLSLDPSNGTKLSTLIQPNGPLFSPTVAVNTPQFFEITGKLNVDISYTFSNGSELVMAVGSQIFLIDGSTLNISRNAHLYGSDCSGGKWKGVYVGEECTLTLGSISTPYGSISDAEKGVYLSNHSNLSATCFHFEDDKVGIETNNNNGIKQDIDLHVVACEFSNTSKTPGPKRAGMRLFDLPESILETFKQHFTLWYLSFTRMEIGIDATNCDLNIRAGLYTNLEYGVYAKKACDIEISGWSALLGAQTGVLLTCNLDPYAGEFNAVDYGVYGQNSSIRADRLLMSSIEKTGFVIDQPGASGLVTELNQCCVRSKGVGISVKASNANQGLIRFCDIQSKSNSIDLSTYSPPNEWEIFDNRISSANGNGIVATNFQEAAIKVNSITAASANRLGIRITGGKQNEVECNRGIKGGLFGVRVFGSPECDIACNDIEAERALVIVGACDNTKTRGNNLTGNNIDLEYGTTAISALTTKQFYQRNRFLGAMGSGLNARHHDQDPGIVLKSKYNVSTSEDQPCEEDFSQMPTFDAAATDWFEDLIDQNSCSFQCEVNCKQVPGSVTECGTNTDEFISQFHQVGSSLPEGMQWTLRRHLLERAVEGDCFWEFVEQESTTSVGRFQEAREAIRVSAEPPASFTAQIESLQSAATQKRHDQAVLSEYSIQNGSLLFDAAVFAQKQQLRAETAQLLQQIASLRATQRQAELAALADANTSNAAMPSAEIYESNQKTINRILIQRLIANEETEWSATDLADLTAIAEQCSVDGGDAVFQAQGLLQGMGIDFDNDAPCENTHERTKDAHFKTNTASVFPNPTTGNIQLLLPPEARFSAETDVTIAVFDKLGRSQQVGVRRMADAIFSLDVRSLSDGLFFGTATSSDGRQFSFLFIVQNSK